MSVVTAYLDSQGIDYIKDDRKNVSIRCEECGGKKNVHIDTGMYRCFGCNKKGRLNIEGLTEVSEEKLDDTPFDPSIPKLEGFGVEYIRSRGLDSPTTIGYDDYRNAIVFPFHNDRGEVVGHHYRYLPTAVGGEEPKQKYSIQGQSTGYFIADLDLYKKSEIVIITEGQFDALSLAKLGINAVATCGAGNKKIVELLPERFTKRFIAFDNDTSESTRQNINKFEQELARELRARPIRVPAKDVNDWLQRGDMTSEEVYKLCFESHIKVHASEYVGEMSKYLVDPKRVAGQPTGFWPLDDVLGGGYRTGELIVTHAEAKSGKNTFWHFLMLPLLDKGIPIGYCSRELSPDTEILPNLLTLATGVNVYKKKPTPELIDKYTQTAKKWNLYFAEGFGLITLEELTEWMFTLRYAYGVRYFFLDHLHFFLVNPEDHQLASIFIKAIKTFAKQHDVCINLIVQPNKIPETSSIFNGQVSKYRPKLSLNSIKGGAAIGQALDSLITIERVRDSDGKRTNVSRISLEVARSKLAKPGEFFVEYDPDTMKFVEVEAREDEDTNLKTSEEPPPEKGKIIIKKSFG